ncbi:hypothetical protein [Haloarcula sp. JP-L23]|uniref:hypothetical protein n=1 Tax=Haloarcula sp. JP-L23 TaxID=2716717 RepID=UPI00140EAF6C|nr:hypothetical protein G9465_13030 [Haloarcula sp. JP-L23]
MIDAFRLADLATQPRFLLPILFPVMAYLGWRWDGGGRLRNHLLAVLGIDVVGSLLATVLESQPIDGSLVNALQGVALLVVAVIMYTVWRRFDWSPLVQGWALVAAVSIVAWLPARTVFTLSGGVIVPTATLLYLATQRRVLAVLLPIPALRVVVSVMREGYGVFDVLAALCLAVGVVAFVLIGWSADADRMLAVSVRH